MTHRSPLGALSTIMKTLGVLTSGGDAPGMNPAIRAVVRTAIQQGCRVVGINNGYDGVFEGDVEELGNRLLSGMIDRGGTILQSSRANGCTPPRGWMRPEYALRSLAFRGLW